MRDAVEMVSKFKKNVLGGYVRALNRIDPQVAEHILESQRQAFLAGRSFFDAEAGHAARAIAKIKAKREAPPA